MRSVVHTCWWCRKETDLSKRVFFFKCLELGTDDIEMMELNQFVHEIRSNCIGGCHGFSLNRLAIGDWVIHYNNVSKVF